MTDQHGHRADHRADDHETEVRRLLADARSDDPMPAHVAERLDRVLVGLAEESRQGAVTSLATRRRRVAQLLVAAAAVLVIGVGVGQVVDGSGTMSAESSDSAGSDEREALSDRRQADDPGAEEDGIGASEPDAELANEPEAGASRERLLELSSEDFSSDRLSAQARGYLSTYDVGALDRRDAVLASCRAAAWGRGDFVPVTYEGTPGVLVLRRAVGDTRTGDLYLCGSVEPLHTVTLPAP